MPYKHYKERELKIGDNTYYPFKDVLVIDIECAKKDETKEVSPENSIFKIWGAFSYNDGKVHYGFGNRLQELIDSHKVIVGHNIKGYDIPVLEQQLNVSFKYKVLADTLEILRAPPSRAEKEAYKKKGLRPLTGKGRAAIIGEAQQKGMKDDRFPDLSLATVAQHGHYLFKDSEKYSKFFEQYKIEDFDYSILNKSSLEDEEWNYIKQYLKQDIVVTKNIFEFLEKYFETLAEYLPKEDIEKLQYVIAPTGTYAYKVICNELDLPEEYGESEGSFVGAYVFLPERERYGPEDGDGYCKDFKSQHPSHQRMMNLFTPTSQCPRVKRGEVDKCPTAHSGDGKIFKLKGTYCACEQGEIEKLLTKWYLQRLEFKKNKDPREYTIKILINATYGISSSAIFKSIYNPTTGEDTTRMSQQSIKFMRDWLQERGYIVAYGDTDSVYLMDPYNDKEKLNQVIEEGVQKIRDALPFVDKYYDMGTDAEFSHIFFFRDENDKQKRFKKKNYIYITKDNQVKINGLPLLKRNAPKIAKKIYTDYLEPEIKRTKNIKFDRGWLKQLLRFEIEKDKNILATKIIVKAANNYANSTQLQAQISENYFEGKEGIFYGIKHKRKDLGIGKGVRYCSVEEADKLKFEDIDLAGVWKVLDPFIKKDKQTSLGDW